MGKTNKKIVEDKVKQPESPTHKKRREQQDRLREIKYEEITDDDDYDDIETFERIRPKR